jgi:hypothetical protein
LTFRALDAYSLGAMRTLSFGVILTFFIASMHMVVDHGGGPRDFVLLPHVATLPFQADDHSHEPPGSPAPSPHDADTHTHVEWYTTAAGSHVPSQLLVSLILERSAWLTEQLSTPSPHVRITAAAHSPPAAPLYLHGCSFLA